MTLTYKTQIRSETDPAIINNLQRKGWVENPPPAYEPATHRPPTWNGSTWLVESLSSEELAAIAAQAADAADAQWVKSVVSKLLNPGADTQAQRLARLERILARLVKSMIS